MIVAAARRERVRGAALMLQHSTPAGLCASCANCRVVESRGGSRFYLCRLARTDPAFPKYPRLPVLRCRGYRVDDDPAATGEAT